MPDQSDRKEALIDTGSEIAPPRPVEWKKFLFFLPCALCGLAVGAYFIFDPSKIAIFPQCFFHEITGLDCPGCGAQRALHQLLHGNIIPALRMNAMFVLSLPIWALYGPRLIWRAYKGQPTGLDTRWLWIYLVAWLVFGFLRNLPAAPFAWFAA